MSHPLYITDNNPHPDYPLRTNEKVRGFLQETYHSHR